MVSQHDTMEEIYGKSIIEIGAQLCGVFVSVPPHLASEEKPLAVNEMYIDTGYSKEELEKIVSLGDTISFDTTFKKLLGNRVSGSALDDRSGVVAILYALEFLKNENLNCELQILFSTEEEVGERGAATGAFYLNPDIAIAVDVSFAYASGEKEDKCGKMGKGVMIGISPSLDRELSHTLISIAKEKNIPYQTEVMNGRTGTNADRFSVNRKGAKASTLSIPLKYMHTPTEIIDTEDIVSVSKLIAEYVKGVK
ncbi:MAG: M20/M25/M40 family metallo-hydrolase [Oscillospiraceae bacterium]|nr:M20/M25/M40 family metallo-hydrolase [Oscillospiraceae bacterium]